MPWLATAPSLPLRKARAASDDPAWRVLHRLADAAIPAMLDEVAAVLASVGVALDRGALAGFLSTGQLAAADALIQQAWEAVGVVGLQATLAPRLEALALDAALVTPVATVSVRFNVQDPEAIQAIRDYVGAKIVAISATTQEAVQGIVQRAFETGTPLTQQITEIASTVGLTPRQAESVSRFREGLLEAGEKPGRVHELVARRGEALKRQRGENIARSEAMSAISQGQQARWEQSIRDGLLRPDALRRFWVITNDARTCPVCLAIPGMNAEGVGLAEPFQTPSGAVAFPPAHPSCRCAVNGRVTA